MIHNINESKVGRYASANEASTMMALGDPTTQRIPEKVLQAPGGFAWWYVDSINANGDGVVIIWSFGLPFLPGYLSKARQGEGQPAIARPSINISVYQKGKRAFYLLQEYASDQVHYDHQGNFRFGDNYITQSPTGKLSLDIRCPLPNCPFPLTGSLQLEGAPVSLPPDHPPSNNIDHRWTPIVGPSQLTGHLDAGKTRYTFNDLAYHDRNEGTKRLDDLGIGYWSWGRLVTSSHTTIWYALWPHEGDPVAWGLNIRGDGQTSLHTQLRVRCHHRQRSIFGLSTWRYLEIVDAQNKPWLSAHFGPRLDNGPFYARTPATITTPEGNGTGLGEWIAPARIDHPWHRPLVRMAVHHLSGLNSPFLPLFCGPQSGRMMRLLSRN